MAGEHIVVVDDDPDIRDALTMILEWAGYRVTCCASVPEGLAEVRAAPPHLVMLDVMLASPADGLKLAHEMRVDEALSKIPIIMISSYGPLLRTELATELAEIPVPPEMFLDKPLTSDSVVKAVEAVLEQAASR